MQLAINNIPTQWFAKSSFEERLNPPDLHFLLAFLTTHLITSSVILIA